MKDVLTVVRYTVCPFYTSNYSEIRFIRIYQANYGVCNYTAGWLCY